MTEKQIIRLALLCFAASVVAAVYATALYLEGCSA